MVKLASARKRLTRVLIGTSVALAGLSVVLTGCSSADRISAKLDHGQVMFVACDVTSANGIALNAAIQKSEFYNYKRIWVVAGSGKFGPDTPVTAGSAPSGFHSTLGPRPFDLRKVEIEFALNRYSRSGTLVAASVAHFDGSKLVSGRWLRWDGTVADSACP